MHLICLVAGLRLDPLGLENLQHSREPSSQGQSTGFKEVEQKRGDEKE